MKNEENIYKNIINELKIKIKNISDNTKEYIEEINNLKKENNKLLILNDDKLKYYKENIDTMNDIHNENNNLINKLRADIKNN